MKNKIIGILRKLGVKAEAAKHHKISSNLWDETLEDIAIRIMEQLGECYVKVKCEDELPDTDDYLFVMEKGHYHLPNSCVYEKSDGLWFDRSGSVIDVDWWLKKLPPHPKEEEYVCGLCKDEKWVNDPNGLSSSPCPNCGGNTKEYAEYKAKEETDWNKLREQFFEECCEMISGCEMIPGINAPTSIKQVAMAPHDLFEWFKKNVETIYPLI